MGRHGGFASHIRVHARFAIPVPDALASENAAPLLCAGITTLPVFPLLANKSVVGSNTGSTAGLRDMLQVAARHGVKAQTERFPLAMVNDAMGRVARNEVRYRAVLEL